MSIIEKLLWEQCYTQSPNNIWAHPGNRWSASGPGIMQPANGEEVWVIGDKIILLTDQAHRRLDGFMTYTFQKVVEFSAVGDYFIWLNNGNGEPSEGGRSFDYNWG